jgi:hypothetical protein
VVYVIERVDRKGRQRYTGMSWAANGKAKSAGTFDTHERAYEVASEAERETQAPLGEVSPAEKATMTIREFGEERFLRYLPAGARTRQQYGYTLKNHIYP